MLKPKKRITKKELKQDTLVSTYAMMTSYYYEYKKYVSYGITAIVALVIVIIVINNNRRANNEKASSELAKAFTLYDAGATNPRSYQLAIDGQPERGIMGLKAIVENYGSTHSGELARFYLANACFNLGQIDEAFKHFDNFSSDDKTLGASALAGLASCYEYKKNYEKASSYYEKAANMVSNAQSTPAYLHFAARCYALSGDKEKAAALYKRLKKEFPTSGFAREAERYIVQYSA